MQTTEYQKELHKIRTTVVRDMAALHPECALAFRELAEYLRLAFKEGVTHSDFRVFETYRHPLRQVWLMEQGTTKAAIYKSAHQFGMAVDFVPGKQVATGFHWSWSPDEDWGFLKKSAELYGLEAPIAWDRAHVQSKQWRTLIRHLP